MLKDIFSKEIFTFIQHMYPFDSKNWR